MGAAAAKAVQGRGQLAVCQRQASGSIRCAQSPNYPMPVPLPHASQACRVVNSGIAPMRCSNYQGDFDCSALYLVTEDRYRHTHPWILLVGTGSLKDHA